MGIMDNVRAKALAAASAAAGSAPQANTGAANGAAKPAAAAQASASPNAAFQYSSDPQQAFNQAMANGLRGEDLVQTLQHQQGWTNGGAYYPDRDQYGFETFYAAPNAGKDGFDLVDRTPRAPKFPGAPMAGASPSLGAGTSAGFGPPISAAPTVAGSDQSGGIWKQLLAQMTAQNPDGAAMRTLVGR